MNFTIGAIYRVINPVKHQNKDFGTITPEINLTLKQTLNGVGLVVPWNSGNETMILLSNLKRYKWAT